MSGRMVTTGLYLESRRCNMALTLTGNIKIGGTVVLGGDGKTKIS